MSVSLSMQFCFVFNLVVRIRELNNDYHGEIIKEIGTKYIYSHTHKHIYIYMLIYLYVFKTNCICEKIEKENIALLLFIYAYSHRTLLLE